MDCQRLIVCRATTWLIYFKLFHVCPLGSSISGLAESTAAANRLHAISIFPEYHMELHLISIASLKPMVSQQASWCFCWFENSHPVA
ncbi:hypothetical protein T01_13620 [Trichinella spiralis]|uniref:Uncharacterized protein n=1 Tax=Trichinella spiralis TaxID=6334 RepID=A0A0V0Z1N5_TRISP|nr:hypothetical protein T01_13620 [Trichinella spiralis]